jgi:hypothetical protein
MNKNIRFITRTAIILALTIVFQTLGRFIPLGQNSQFVVGPLVNACLVIATGVVGLGAGALIAIISPFGAILTGAAVPLALAPFIALGNFVLVLFFYLLFKKNIVAGVITGSVIKFAVLLASINIFVEIMGIPGKKAEVLLWAFSWPQLITALVGGFIALGVIAALKKNIEV